MKKLTLFFAALCCSATMMAQSAVGSIIRYNYMGNNLFYKVKNFSATEGTVSVVPESSTDPYYSEVNKPTGDLVLPDTIEDDGGFKYAVKELSQSAFGKCTGITSFTNNNLITAIYPQAFDGCKNLAVVDLKNVTSIGDYAFRGAPIQDIKMDKVQSIGMVNFGAAVYTTLYINKNLTSFDSQSSLFSSHVKKVVVDPENVIFKEIDGIVYKKLNSENFNCIVGCVKDTNYLVTIPECVDTMIYRALENSYLDLVMPSQKVVGEKYIDDSRNGIKGKMYVACHLHDAYAARTGYYKAGNLVDTLLFTFDAVSADALKGTVAKSEITNCNEITLTATPESGYKFFRWSDGNDETSRNYNITSSTTLTAEWMADNESYLNVVSENETMGTVSGTGIYTNGSGATITATPNSDYLFVQWSDGNTENPRVYTVTKDDTITASFKIKVEVNITLNSSNSEWGSVVGTGVYPEGSSVTISAEANRGYVFTQWSDGNTDNPRIITAEKDSTLTAIFAMKPIAVGDTIRYNYMGNTLFYKVTNVSASSRAVSVVPENSGNPYYSEANKPTGDLVLPDSVADGFGVKFAVKQLASYAFSGTDITSFTNNSIITAISLYAFRDSKNLTTVDLKNATSISDYAFYGAPIQNITMDNVQSIGMSNFGAAVYTTLYINKNLTSFDSQSSLFSSHVKKVVVDPENVIFKEIDGIVYKKLNSENFNCIVGCVKDTNYLVTIPECVDTMTYRALENSYLDLVMPSQKVVGVKYIDDSRNGIKGKMYVACHLYDAYVPRTGYYKAGNLVDTLLYNVALVATNGEITREKVEGECEQVKLTAVPASGYKFDKWSDGETENPRTFEITSDTTITALFVASTPTALEQVALNSVEVRDGRVYCDGEFRIYDTLGRDVTRMNGKLNGVYVVRCGDKSAKVVVR